MCSGDRFKMKTYSYGCSLNEEMYFNEKIDEINILNPSDVWIPHTSIPASDLLITKQKPETSWHSGSYHHHQPMGGQGRK